MARRDNGFRELTFEEVEVLRSEAEEVAMSVEIMRDILVGLLVPVQIDDGFVLEVPEDVFDAGKLDILERLLDGVLAAFDADLQRLIPDWCVREKLGQQLSRHIQQRLELAVRGGFGPDAPADDVEEVVNYLYECFQKLSAITWVQAGNGIVDVDFDSRTFNYRTWKSSRSKIGFVIECNGGMLAWCQA